MAPPTTTVPPRRGSLDWWVRSKDGRLAVAQWPNPALWVWAASWLVGRADLSSEREALVDGVGHGALLVWALDEVVRGDSPLRRVLGAGVLAFQAAALLLR